MKAPTSGLLRTLAAIERLRDVRREQARLAFARARDRQRSAELDARAAGERRADEAFHAQQAFNRRPDVHARTRWLEHLQVLEERRIRAGGLAEAAASAVEASRQAVAACDAQLKAAQVLAAKLDQERRRGDERRAARSSDALWLARQPSEAGPW